MGKKGCEGKIGVIEGVHSRRNRLAPDFRLGPIFLRDYVMADTALETPETAARTPFTGRTVPDSSSSPSTMTRSSGSCMSMPFAAPRTARAMERSKELPSFRRSAGLRLMRIRSRGNSKPEFRTAARIRSRASRTAPSGSPTRSTAGIPRRKSASTLIISPSYPKWAKLTISMASSGFPIDGISTGGPMLTNFGNTLV